MPQPRRSLPRREPYLVEGGPKQTNVVIAEAVELPGIMALSLTKESNGFALWRKTPKGCYELLGYYQEDKNTAVRIYSHKIALWRGKEKAFAQTP